MKPATFNSIFVGTAMFILGAIFDAKCSPSDSSGSAAIQALPSSSTSQWNLMWSNTVPCPVAICRIVGDRMESLPVDYSEFPEYKLLQSAKIDPKPKAEADPYDTTKFRVMTDGTRWKVQEDRGYGWIDDTWGGYFPTEAAARERIETRRKFWRERDRDAATQKNFNEVKP
jgi:hypothetical protein